MDANHQSFITAACLMALGLVSSLFVNDAGAAPTMAAASRGDAVNRLQEAA